MIFSKFTQISQKSQHVQVKVTEVDEERKRIQLTMVIQMKIPNPRIK